MVRTNQILGGGLKIEQRWENKIVANKIRK